MDKANPKGKRIGLSGNQLKIVAITAMLTDHLVSTIWPGYDNKTW